VEAINKLYELQRQVEGSGKPKHKSKKARS
jgi:hypothetical protein